MQVYHTFRPGWWFGCHQFYFPIYWECHHPNWLIFFRGIQTTNQRHTHMYSCSTNFLKRDRCKCIIWIETNLRSCSQAGFWCCSNMLSMDNGAFLIAEVLESTINNPFSLLLTPPPPEVVFSNRGVFSIRVPNSKHKTLIEKSIFFRFRNQLKFLT